MAEFITSYIIVLAWSGLLAFDWWASRRRAARFDAERNAWKLRTSEETRAAAQAALDAWSAPEEVTRAIRAELARPTVEDLRTMEREAA